MALKVLNRKIAYKILLLLIGQALLLPIALSAAEINYPTAIHKYRMQDGLSNDLVYDICQDSDGCLWFATAEGISKFDGSAFSSYSWDQKGSETANNQALKIVYRQNKLYIATPFGLVVYNMELNQFKILLPDSIHHSKIRALANSRDGNLWVGVYGDGGVYKFNITDESFTRLNYEYVDNRIISLYEDKNGYLYVGTHFGGFDVVHLKTNRSTHYDSREQGMPDKQVEEIIEDSLGNIWLGTWGGLVLYNKTTRQLTGITNNLLRNCKINTLAEDKNGILWVGTESGLLSFNIREALVNPSAFKMDVYAETRDEYGLSYRTVLALHSDSDNNVWIGTNSGGVNLISRLHPKFDRIIYDPRLENSLSYRRVTSVSEDLVGNFWIATDGGGLNYYDKISKKVIIQNTKNSNLSDDAVLCSLVDSDGDAWFGTYYNALNRKTKNSSQFIVYKGSETAQNTLMGGDLLCLEEDDYHRIWIGQRSGLVYFDKNENSFVQIPELKWLCVKCIAATKDGIYLGAHPGVLFYDFVTQKVKKLNPVLEGLFANCLLVDQHDNLWIGTSGQGAFYYNTKNGSIRNYNIQSGLPSNTVYKILQDNENNTWLTTTKGVTKIFRENNTILNFNSRDGVQPGMFIDNSGIRTRSGQILFGGTEGLTLFYPNDVKKETHVPNIIFTNFLLFNNPVEVKSSSNPGSPLKKTINFVDEITLEYDESVFSIEYTAVDCISADRINYAYILEGVDKDWNFVREKKTATYRYLVPGTYIFKVMASNLDEVFDPSYYRSIKIVINPPFYLTWWAYIFYAVLLCVIGYFTWNFITVKTRALNEIKYERLERSKSEELHQEKLQFFTNISHELRTPLTLIAAPVDRLLKDETSEDKIYLLSLIKRNVIRLLNNVNEIMDIRKVDRNQMKLKVKELDIISFVGEVVDLFQDLARSKQIELEYSYQDESCMVWIDPEFLDKILCNILSNALKFTPDHGEIIVNLFINNKDNSEEDRLYIEITDTGKGISEEHLPLIFDRFFQTNAGEQHTAGMGSGVGLHLVKSLVELHNGNIFVESKLGVGTTFVLSFPCAKEDYPENERAKTEYVYHHAEHLSSIAVAPEYSPENRKKMEERCDKILIVDDDQEILNFLKFELSNDYEIELAENGKTGLEKACEIIPSIIISDIMMPELDGISLCQELKSNINTSHIPIILLTAKGSVDDRIEGLEVGADSYISKPFDIRHLRVRIKKLIGLRETIQSSFVKELSNPVVEKNAGASTIDEKLLQKIVTFILSDISNSDINGETIAGHVSMSRMSLHRKLKALTGLSAGEFIRNIRLEEAKKMLEAGGKTVSEVSYDVGYSSPSYFYTCFVRKFGVSPSDIK